MYLSIDLTFLNQLLNHLLQLLLLDLVSLRDRLDRGGTGDGSEDTSNFAELPLSEGPSHQKITLKLRPRRKV